VWSPRRATLELKVGRNRGAHDVLIHQVRTRAMTEKLSHAKLVIDSDAEHGFLVQHVHDFAREVLDFLD
jgi:hypothetical protein